VIFIDSNVPMYLVGAAHPHKIDAQRWLEQLAADQQVMVTDAEVFQEILHRYRAIDRPDAIQPAFDVLLALVETVLPIGVDVVASARDLLLARWGLSARDAIHVAAMTRHGLTQILSFDRGFDEVPGIVRLGS
jgi:predicted nucleic acid-binding protein